MFLSRSATVIRIVFFITIVTLASCSSVKPIKQNSNKTQTKLESTNEQVNIGGTDEGSNAIDIRAIVDPMADIQINAEIKKSYAKVSKFNREKKYSLGLNELDRIKLKYPQLSGPDYQKARLYLNQSKYTEALEAVNVSLKNNNRNYYSLTLKGIILKEMGKFIQAKESYLKAIDIYYPYVNSHLNLGVLSDVYTGELSLALIQYKQYLKLTSENKGQKNKRLQVENWVVELERRIKKVEQ